MFNRSGSFKGTQIKQATKSELQTGCSMFMVWLYATLIFQFPWWILELAKKCPEKQMGRVFCVKTTGTRSSFCVTPLAVSVGNPGMGINYVTETVPSDMRMFWGKAAKLWMVSLACEEMAEPVRACSASAGTQPRLASKGQTSFLCTLKFKRRFMCCIPLLWIKGTIKKNHSLPGALYFTAQKYTKSMSCLVSYVACKQTFFPAPTRGFVNGNLE